MRGFSDSDSKSHDNDANKKQNSNSSESCKVILKLLIPEDLIFDILSFLPVSFLHNSARYVCKLWATTIRSSFFAEACLHRARSKPGLYVENCKNRYNSYFLEFKDDVDDRFEFERVDLGTPPGMGTIFGSCDGIMLLYHDGLGQIFVVNPTLRCWLKVPPLTISLKQPTIKGRFTIARAPRTAIFKLFFIDKIEVSGVYWYVFCVLRIGVDSSWKEIVRKEARFGWFCLWELLYSRDNYLYFTNIHGTTVMDVDKEIIVGEYSCPPVSMPESLEAVFLWMGNHLSFIDKISDETYQIYILNFDSGKWSLYHEIEIRHFDLTDACGFETDFMNVVFCLWINHQIIFRAIVWRRGFFFIGGAGVETMHFSYNVKTRQLTKIEDIVEGDNIEIWLHTNSLVSLPGPPT